MWFSNLLFNCSCKKFDPQCHSQFSKHIHLHRTSALLVHMMDGIKLMINHAIFCFLFLAHFIAVHSIYWVLLQPWFETRIINFYEGSSAAFTSVVSECFRENTNEFGFVFPFVKWRLIIKCRSEACEEKGQKNPLILDIAKLITLKWVHNTHAQSTASTDHVTARSGHQTFVSSAQSINNREWITVKSIVPPSCKHHLKALWKSQGQKNLANEGIIKLPE